MSGDCILRRHDDGRVEVLQADPEIVVSGGLLRDMRSPDEVFAARLTLRLPGGVEYELSGFDEIRDVWHGKRVA